jgi:hypothetical protein
MWTDTTTGERVGSIRYEAHVGHESVRVRLNYTKTGWDGERCESDCWIQFETTSQPFGGRRWWFICQRAACGRRNSTCPTAPSPSHHVSPTGSHTLANVNQSSASSSGASLGRRAESGDYVAKPKLMRWSTYDRKLEEIFAAEEIVDAHTLILDRKLDRCLGR